MDKDGFENRSRHKPNTLVAIGPGQICVSKKTDDKFSNKDFPRGQLNGLTDDLDFEIILMWDRPKN